MRRLILILVAGFMLVFTLLTVSEISRNGLDAFGVLAILILGLLATGLIGALRHPPPE